MKLIIDIDEEDVEIMKHNISVDNPLCPLSQEEMVYKVAKGIPLDKISAEIENYKSTIDKAISEDELKIEGIKEAYMDCIKIIDKYKSERSKE